MYILLARLYFLHFLQLRICRMTISTVSTNPCQRSFKSLTLLVHELYVYKCINRCSKDKSSMGCNTGQTTPTKLLSYFSQWEKMLFDRKKSHFNNSNLRICKFQNCHAHSLQFKLLVIYTKELRRKYSKIQTNALKCKFLFTNCKKTKLI